MPGPRLTLTLAVSVLPSPALAQLERMRLGWDRVAGAVPEAAVVEAWAAALAPVAPGWLAAVAALVLGWLALGGLRARIARSVRLAPTGRGKGAALARYALAAFAPLVLAALAVVGWGALAHPTDAKVELLALTLLPFAAAMAAMALTACAFTTLSAFGRIADRSITHRLPPQIGAMVALAATAALLRETGPTAPAFFGDVAALVLETLAAVLAWHAIGQQRRTLRQLLRGESGTPADDPPTLPERMTSWLADRWHILARAMILLGLAGRYGLFGPERRFGVFADLAASVALVLLAGISILLSERLHGWLLARWNVTAATGLGDRLALRLGRVLRTGVQIALALWAAALILWLWQPELALTGDGGAIGRAVAAVLTAILALYALWFIWTLVDTVLDWSASQSLTRGTRTRTLLPFLRNFAFIVVATIGGISVLSNLGVDVAPLLAGAGVVGIAIGIGAQKLVGDVITGIFIIFEDSIAIGETVEAAAKTGVVEGLTIRTLRLRDGDGALHSIPFSSITTLKNASRGYSSYTVSVTILNPRDTDRALAELSRIGHEIAEDEDWKKVITGPFSLWGVDQITPAGVVIKGAIRSHPNAQWGLGREFNRRIALGFSRLGIAQVAPPVAPVAPA